MQQQQQQRPQQATPDQVRLTCVNWAHEFAGAHNIGIAETMARAEAYATFVNEGKNISCPPDLKVVAEAQEQGERDENETGPELEAPTHPAEQS